MQRGSNALAGFGGVGEALPPRTARAVARAVDNEVAGGIVRAAQAQADTYVADTKVRGAAFVARTAMTCAVERSAYEEQCLRHAPLGEGRYRLIADSFAFFAANEITNLGRP
jgi:hypothetical protein